MGGDGVAVTASPPLDRIFPLFLLLQLSSVQSSCEGAPREGDDGLAKA